MKDDCHCNATAAEKAKEAAKKKQEAEKKSSNMTTSDVAGFAPQPQMRAGETTTITGNLGKTQNVSVVNVKLIWIYYFSCATRATGPTTATSYTTWSHQPHQELQGRS